MRHYTSPAAPVPPPTRVVAVPTPVSEPHAPAPRVPKITLLLVLAHHFEHLISDGVVMIDCPFYRANGHLRVARYLARQLQRRGQHLIGRHDLIGESNTGGILRIYQITTQQ